MASPIDDEEWEEDIEELLEEGGEEEEEQIPQGYLAADGPYKHFCTCQDNITCNFCSWFHLIRECQVHGKATLRPPKPCYCHKKGAELQAVSTIQQFSRSQLFFESRRFDPCECRKTTVAFKCDCLDDVVTSASESDGQDDRPSTYDIIVDDVRGEVHDDGLVTDEDGSNDYFEPKDELPESKNVGVPERPETAQDGRQPRPCTCDDEPEPRSGSSTELESSVFESSDTDSSSQYDLGLFGNLNGASSDITSSENSSAEGTDVDWTRVRWIHNASDRSVESVSDDGYDERKRRRVATRKLRARPRRRRAVQKNTSDKPIRHQYLVVQQSRKKNFLDICRDKKEQPHSYSYQLMRIV